jgi:uncharacterized protein YjiS (DUF1127 family)
MIAQYDFAPRTIAAARTRRFAYFGRLVRFGFRRIRSQISAWCRRVAMARQYDRDIAMLMQADIRMLRDIGLTRADVHAAAQKGVWRNSNRMLEAAADRRSDAIVAAQDRHPSLPRVDAPALAPNAFGRAIERMNFRR